jgi:hypothetical protein
MWRELFLRLDLSSTVRAVAITDPQCCHKCVFLRKIYTLHALRAWPTPGALVISVETLRSVALFRGSRRVFYLELTVLLDTPAFSSYT